MFSSLEFWIALRYLKAKRKEGFISVIAIFSFVGIMIGVATLIIVMSVMNGFRYELVGRILGINSHLTVYSRADGIENYQKLVDGLRQIPGVVYANPLVESQVMVAGRGKAVGGLVKGIAVEDLKHKELIADNIIHGELNSLEDKNTIIVGSTLANNLNLEVGDTVKLISPETNSTIVGTVPRIKSYKIGGIFESGMYEYDSTTIFMPIYSAQVHFRYKEKASAAEVFVSDANNMEEAHLAVRKLLANNYPSTYLVDWQQSNASFIDALNVERNVMFLILTLIILVAAFNIISSLIMLVNDKNKNIACLRTMGISSESVMRIFLICGSMIGVTGTFFGFIIGVLFSANINTIKKWLEAATDTTLFNPTIYFLSNLPSRIFVSDVVLIVGMALILSFLATIYPAYKASKSNPADIVRYE
jgi:lipoprotein-releasing system permease protein